MSKERGFAPIIFVIIAAVLALGAGGYFLANKSGKVPSVASIPGVGQPLNPNCKYNDPDLCKFVNNWKDIKNYSVKSTSTTKGGEKDESTFELSGEDRFHMISSQNNKESYNVITIADTTYTKDYSDNKWWKQKAPKTQEDIKDKFEFKVEDDKDNKVEDKTTYKALGKEACGNRQCFKYQIVNPDFTDQTEYIWFDDKEYLLRRSRSESKEFTNDSTISYDRVNISEPSPTKDAKPEDIIVPGLSSKEQEDLKKEMEKAAKDAQQIQQTAPETPVEDATVDNSSFEEQ